MGVDPAIIDAALSPDGTRLVTTGWDGTAHVWGLDGEGLITVLHPPPSDYVGAAYTAAVSPDGGKIAVYASVAIDLVTSEDPNGFAVLRIWDAATFQQALEMKGPWGQIPGRIAFSPDGSLVALADKNRFRLFDSTTGAEVRTIEGRETIADFQFSKDGSRILSSSGLAGSAEIWDVGTGTVLTRFSGGSGARTSARFSPDEARVAMTASNGTARIWGFEPHPAAGVVLKLEGKLGDITFSPDGVLLATCALTDFPSTDAGEPDFAAARAVVTAWDVASREKVWELRDIVGGCGLAFSRDGARLAMHSYRAVKIVEARTGKTLVSIDAVTEDGGQLAFNPDGAYLVSTSPGAGANVRDAASGQHVRELAGSATVQELRFSPDGTLLALSDWDRRVRVFNFATGALRSELPAQASVVTTLAFTPDGARLVTSDGKSLRLWDAASGALVADFVRNATADGTSSGNPQKFAISPDGRRLLVDEIGELALFDLETFREIGSYKAFSGSQRGPEFTPDGTRFVLTSPPPDPSLSVVDLETLQPVLGKPLDNSLGADPYVGPDGRTIATYRLLIDYEVGLWRVFPTTGELLEAAKREVPRCLTPEERAAYYLPEVEPDWCHTLARWPFFRPRLGIKMSEREGKVILDGYFAGSLAESAGFAAGDAIVAIDGEPIKNLDRVSELVAHADSTLMFTVERAGELKEIRVSFPPR
jgi:WD40 repeat protein